MGPTSRFRAWLGGWAGLARRGEIPGYTELGLVARARLDVRALALALRKAVRGAGFAGAALACVAAGLGAQVIAWRLDLAGWRRDALLCLPVLLAAPWVAEARRRHVEALLGATRVTER